MWCALLIWNILEVWVDAQITLTPCVSDTGANVSVAEVRQNETNQFYCRGLEADARVDWVYLGEGGSAPEGAGICWPRNNSFRGRDPLGEFSTHSPPSHSCKVGNLGDSFAPKRSSDSESVMTVSAWMTTAKDRVKTGSALGCRQDINGSLIESNCLMDLIDPAQGSCSVKFERENDDDAWVATGSCAITAYSSLGRYTCHWYRTRNEYPEEFQSAVPYTLPPGVCNFSQPLPPAGRYSYRVRITPGNVSEQASFGSNSNQISSPQSTSRDLPELKFKNNPTLMTFDVTAYPPPRPNPTFTYLGPEGMDEPSPPANVALSAWCMPKTAAPATLHACSVAVMGMTSGNAAGVYTVAIANAVGSRNYTFKVSYQPVKTTPIAVNTVKVAMTVAIAVLTTALIACGSLNVWLWRRPRKIKKGSRKPGKTKYDLEKTKYD